MLHKGIKVCFFVENSGYNGLNFDLTNTQYKGHNLKIHLKFILYAGFCLFLPQYK
jgi:hypothetical protein